LSAKAHVDRHGRLVADLSTNKEWQAHLAEISTAFASLKEVLTHAANSGDRAIVDTGVYARADFQPGIAVTLDVYSYPAGLLKELAEYGLGLEITVRAIAPD